MKHTPHTKIKFTEADFLSRNPCRDGLNFALARQFDFARIWAECPRGDWLLWLLPHVAPLTKPQAVGLANRFAAQAKRYAAAADASAAAARYADHAGYAATAAAHADHAGYAARSATYAATYDAAANAAYAANTAYAAARAEQADAIRELIPNPFL